MWAEMAFSRSWPGAIVLLPNSALQNPFMMTWKEQSCTMMPLPTLLTFAVTWSKAVSLPYTVRNLFATLLKQDFRESTEGIYLWTRLDWNLFELFRLRAKTRVHEEYVRDLLFADDATITTHLTKTFSGFWTAFQKLVDTLDLPSAWQKHRSWGKTLRRYHCSSLTTTN